MGGNPAQGLSDAEPSNIGPLKAAIKRYTEIVATGGWQPLPDVGSCSRAPAIRPSPCCASACRCPAISRSRKLHSFDFYVDKAVKRYQASNGLAPTGIVDKRRSRRSTSRPRRA